VALDRRPLRGAPFPERGEEFVVGPDRSIDEVVGAYRERARRTEDVVRAAPSLDVPCLGREGTGEPVHVLLDLREPIDLRWVILISSRRRPTMPATPTRPARCWMATKMDP